MPKYNNLLDIKDILDEYSTDIQEGIDKEAQDISKQAANDLKNATGTYHVRTGNYNKGWRVNTKKGRGIINCLVHNYFLISIINELNLFYVLNF